ncbi:hypothetical protein EVAR_83518_1 [Eumeta japonica]|uniref:Uncharacterized protein n=1 Tax=Eumeta variegata TaxID=151549 RepID=A0A4C1Y313_EUMVA|nr:hypothetical protein EVAR_83518_1 [Eumeta japonica]
MNTYWEISLGILSGANFYRSVLGTTKRLRYGIRANTGVRCGRELIFPVTRLERSSAQAYVVKKNWQLTDESTANLVYFSFHSLMTATLSWRPRLPSAGARMRNGAPADTQGRSSATGMVATHLLLPQYHLKGCPPVRGYAKLCEPAHARAPVRRQKDRLSRGPYDP